MEENTVTKRKTRKGEIEMIPEERMYIKEISEYVGVGANTIQRLSWRRKKNFPAGKLGKELVSYRHLLDKWIEERLNGRN